MDKVIDFFVDKKKRNILIGILGIIVLLIILIGCSRVTPLEEKTIKEVSKRVMPYIDRVENSKEEKFNKYVYYALEYAYNEYDKTELTVKEIKKIIENTFNYDINDKKIKSISLTKEMMENNIIYDFVTGKFLIDKTQITQSEIADKKLTFYEIDSIKKISSEHFKVTYDKYVVTNPYEILNYYTDLNNKKSTKKKYDITPIYNYLVAKGKEKDVKNYVIGGNFEKFAKKKGKLKVDYVVKNDKLVIDSYETVK
mgnify:CR=1 FL=1